MLSLIVPINRGFYFPRLLKYYSQLGFPYDIFIPDSCPSLEYEKNRKVINSVSNNLETHHIRFDHEKYNNDRHLILKLAQVAERANTEYVVVCGDDDFIVPRAIEHSIRFLESHPDYSIIHGHAVMFECKTAAKCQGLYYNGLRTQRYSILEKSDSDEPVHRLQSYFSNAGSTFYSIHRRLNFIRNRYLAYEHTSCPHFYEPLLECLDLLQGKSGFLDTLYVVRQVSQHSNSQNPQHIMAWPDFLKSDVYPQEYSRYFNCVTNELVATTHLPLSEAREVIEQGFRSYTAFPEHWASQSRLKRFLWLGWRIARALPAAARFAFAEGKLPAMLRSPHEALDKLENDKDDLAIHKLLSPKSPFRDDFLPIYESMRRYPNGIPV